MTQLYFFFTYSNNNMRKTKNRESFFIRDYIAGNTCNNQTLGTFAPDGCDTKVK